MGLIESAVGYVSLTSVLIVVSVLFALRRVYLSIDENTRLRRLGLRGPKVKSYVPLGKFSKGSPPTLGALNRYLMTER